ncbi:MULTISPECIES: ATP-binding protein [unclassified Butyrivibrio]|uniref:ATP-binding protein n=1 Tax=unclassified Butyrivibrio TaxID=2639466 RepID=UPI000406AE7F|nr:MULTISPECIES: ATP-binding protein [unclassified Butyrivibrio]
MNKSAEIFKPGALPVTTYISREAALGFTYEERLEQALNMSGYITLISGPSKIGKTVLCERVVGIDNLVEVLGSDFLNKENVWKTIGAKAGMPLSGMVTTGNTDNSISEEYIVTRENVIAYYQEHELVLLIDDFHYASEEIQRFLSQQLKDAIRKGLKVIISSLPHRCDDAIRTNPDLQGRISIIDIKPWSKDELRQIPRKGFAQLGIYVDDKYIESLVGESLASPQLMQLLCLNLCVLIKADSGNAVDVSEEIIKKAYKFSTLNLDFKNVTAVISNGKTKRGRERKKYCTSKGELDLYSLILEAIAQDPPIEEIGFDDLLTRINKTIVGDDKVTPKSLKEYLGNIQEVLNDKNRTFEVLEWRDNVLYVIEALFLFYLRWGRNEQGTEY